MATRGKSLASGKTNASELVRSAMKARGYTQGMMAEAMGFNGQSAISMALGGRNLGTDVLVRMLDVLGFDVIVKDRNGSNRENVWKLEFTPDGGDEK